MATPIIRSVGTSSGTVTGTGRNNLVVPETVTLSDTVVGNIGAPHAWAIIDRPIGSSAVLQTPSSATSSFVPDVTGSYKIRCTVNGVSIAEVILSVPLGRTLARIPAYGESTEYDGGGNTKGWHEAITFFMRACETTFVSVGGQLGGTVASPTVLGIRETAGPTLLTFGAIADSQVLIRSGSTVIGTTTVPLATSATSAATATFATTAGGAPPTGSASGDLGGSFPSPTVAAIHETGASTKLTIGAVADGQMLVRSGTTLVGQAQPSGLPPTGTASGDLSGSFPSPNVIAIHEASGPTKLTIGTLTDGEFLKRVGSTLVSAAVSVVAYSTVQVNGSAATQRSILNFSTSFTATDNVTKTDIALADTAVTPGTYTAANITVNSKGQVTSAASGSAAPSSYAVGGYTTSWYVGGVQAPFTNGTVTVTTNIAGTEDIMWALPHFFGRAGTITDLGAYHGNGTGGGGAKSWHAIYRSNAAGTAPGSRVFSFEQVSTGFNTASSQGGSVGITVSAGETIWFVVVINAVERAGSFWATTGASLPPVLGNNWIAAALNTTALSQVGYKETYAYAQPPSTWTGTTFLFNNQGTVPILMFKFVQS